MALEDFNVENGPLYSWYSAALGKLDNTIGGTTNDFGQGKTNTIAMIANWNSSKYGPQHSGSVYLSLIHI